MKILAYIFVAWLVVDMVFVTWFITILTKKKKKDEDVKDQ